MSEIRHSVLMITYNQEHLLPLALDSVFQQSILPYEVIISDDCSTDGTWGVICEYYKRYPTIIKHFRNEINLGVFGNFNKAKILPAGDIISCLSGDDLYKPGIFETFNDEILKNKLDVTTDKFILICNAIDLHKDGKEVVCDNYRYRHEDLFKLKIRYALNFRDTGFSQSLFREISPIREDLGYHADWIYCIDQLIKSNRFVFINKAFPVYRVGVGVVSKSKGLALAESRIKVIDVILESYSRILDKSDIRYLSKERLLNSYVFTKDFQTLSKLLILFLLNLNNYSNLLTLKNDFKFIFLSLCGYILRKMNLR